MTTKINSNINNKVSVEISKYDRYDADKVGYSSKPCFLLEDENNKLCQFRINDLVNLIYKNPKYAVDYGGNGTEILIINQAYRTKSNNTLWIQMTMHQDNNTLTLAVNYSMNGGPWHYYTFGQFNRPSDVDLS